MRWALAVLLLLAAASSGPGMDFDRASSEYIDMGVVAAHALTTAHSATLFLAGSANATSNVAFSRNDGASVNTFRLQDTGGDAWQAFGSNSGGAGDGYVVPGGTPSASTIQAVSWTFSSSSDARLYIDGAHTFTDGTVLETDSGGTSRTVIGARFQGSNFYDHHDGPISLVILHGAQLAADEIAEEATTGLPARIPVSWYRPDLSYGTGSACSGTVYDETATAADGACQNTPTATEIPEERTLR